MVAALAALRGMQAPLLAAILLGACASKLTRVLRHRSMTVILGPTALFPPRLRLPATMALCFTEMSLGVALLATEGPAAGHGRTDAARLATAVFFLVAMCVLVEMRQRRPDLGCGCFGDLSNAPPGARSIVRAGMLAAAALAGLHMHTLRLPPPGPKAVADLLILIAELLVLAAVSPELGEVLVRLGYSEPCEVRSQPPQRPLAALRRSRRWRRHAGLITGEAIDMWRELCWWYVVYPAKSDGKECEVVFAVEVKRRRPTIRAAVVEPGPYPPRAPASGHRPTPVPAIARAPVPASSAVF